MALNQDPLLLTKDDFRDYRDITLNADDTRINQSIREAQMDEMQQFLGDELYLAIMKAWTGTDFPAGPYADLWNGVDYTYQGKQIRFHGLQPAIALYAYARMLDNIQLNVTRAGAVTFVNDESEATAQAQITTKVKSARSQALVYLARADKFLNAKRADYPEYQGKDSQVTSKTSFQFFKV